MNNIIPILRRKNNIKQIDLAKKLNVSPSYLCKIEKGLIDPTAVFQKICSEIFEEQIDIIFSTPPKKAQDIDSKNLPNKLWAARQSKKIKQNKLADMLDCSPSYLSKIEKGLQIPNEKFRKKCAKVLRIKESELFPG